MGNKDCRIENVASGITTRCYLDGVRIVEEAEGTTSPTVERQYAYGPGIDDVVVLFAKNDASYDVYYYLKDPLWTVEALVDENGSIVEAYAYEVYGKPTIKTGAGDDGTWFTADDVTTTTTYLYDANGIRSERSERRGRRPNLTRKDDGTDVHSYAYDIRNLMTSYDGPATSSDAACAYGEQD